MFEEDLIGAHRNTAWSINCLKHCGKCEKCQEVIQYLKIHQCYFHSIMNPNCGKGENAAKVVKNLKIHKYYFHSIIKLHRCKRCRKFEETPMLFSFNNEPNNVGNMKIMQKLWKVWRNTNAILTFLSSIFHTKYVTNFWSFLLE